MPVRHLLAATQLGWPGFATPAAAHVLAQPAAVSAYTMTAGRFWSLVAAALGLAGVVAGGLALARSRRIGTRRRGAIVALVAGPASAVIGALVVSAAEGGPGTGYGIVGGYLDLVLGLIAVLLGGLGLARTRRTSSPADRGDHQRTLG